MTGTVLPPGPGLVPLWLLLSGLVAVLAVSPILAGWSLALSTGVTHRWWEWRPVSTRRWAAVAAVAAALTLAAAGGRPWPAWLLLAAAGAVLIVVDTQQHLLPARLVYPLAAAEAVVLAAAAIIDGDGAALLRAAAAAAAVAAVWLAVLFAAPTAVGLGDVRLFALTGGLLGWTNWRAVLYGELAAFLLAGITALVISVATPARRHRKMQVPMGPAIVAGALLVCWL